MYSCIVFKPLKTIKRWVSIGMDGNFIPEYTVNNMQKKRKCMTKNSDNKYDGYKRPTVTLTPEEHKLIAKFCIDQEITINDFMRLAALHCVNKKIVPEV